MFIRKSRSLAYCRLPLTSSQSYHKSQAYPTWRITFGDLGRIRNRNDRVVGCMSNRELRALLGAASLEPRRLRSERNQEFSMDEDIAGLREEVKSATALVEQRNAEIAKLKRDLERALVEADSARQKAQQLEEKQERQRLELELQKFKEIKALRKQFDEERKAIREDCHRERALWREQNESRASTGSIPERISQVTGELQEREVVDLGPGPLTPTEGSTHVNGGGLTPPVSENPLVEETQETDQRTIPASNDQRTIPASSDSPPVFGSFPTVAPEDREDPSSQREDNSNVMGAVTQLLETQRLMMETQAKAMSTQSVPPLRVFTGDDPDAEDDSFE